VLSVVEGFLEKEIHPTTIVAAYFKALEDIKQMTNELAVPINMENNDDVAKIVGGVIGTKFSSKWGRLIVDLAVKAIKRYAKVEKIPGGMLEDCCVLDGVMFNKDITHPGMRRVIKNPRICLLDCPLEYKKGESMTNMEFT
jgi:T-complex protein 1 subunit gamma